MLTESYVLHTLFDISNTEVLRGYPVIDADFFDKTGQKISNEMQWYKSRNQQRNWETLIQLLSLRVQPTIKTLTKLGNQAIENFGFDPNYGLTASVWRLSFSVDVPEVFKIDNDPVGLLKLDFDRIPMLTGLYETVKITPSYFITNMPGINVTFNKLDE